MGKLILITGGARSGKSTLAEKQAKDSGKRVTYIATSIPIDDEMVERIRLHKEKRPKDWGLIEAYKNFNLSSVDDSETILLDCLTIMVTNIIFDEIEDFDKFDNISKENLDLNDDIEKKIFKEISGLIESLKSRAGLGIMVTNEIGLGLVPETYINRFFRDILGRVNQYIAENSDEVYLCISGIGMKIKG